MVVAIVVLVVFAAVLAVAETSLTRMSRVQGASRWPRRAGGGARPLRPAGRAPGAVLNPVLLVLLACHLAAATLVGIARRTAASVPSGVVVASVFEVVVIFVLAEAVPKTWAHPAHRAGRAASWRRSVERARALLRPLR